jgi:glycine dehydrogenase subunit 1
VYLSTVGKEGLKELSALNMQKAHHLFNRLMDELSVEEYAEQPFFNEFTLRLPKPTQEVVEAMEQDGIFAGVPLNKLNASFPDNLLAVAVTEKRTVDEMDKYVKSMRGVL